MYGGLSQPRVTDYWMEKCKHCAGNCIKAGKQKNGTQKWLCKGSAKYHYHPDIWIAIRYSQYPIRKNMTKYLEIWQNIRILRCWFQFMPWHWLGKRSLRYCIKKLWVKIFLYKFCISLRLSAFAWDKDGTQSRGGAKGEISLGWKNQISPHKFCISSCLGLCDKYP